MIRRWLVIGAFAPSLINFRGPLVRALAEQGPGITASEPAPEPVVQQLSRWGAGHRAFPISRSGLNPLKDLATLFALLGILWRERPSHVLAYTIKPVIWAGIALRLLPGVRYTALITGLGYALEPRLGWRRWLRVLVIALYRAGLGRANAVVFQNADNRDVFLRLGIVPASKCHLVNGSGVDLGHYTVQPLPPLPDRGTPACQMQFLLIARLLGDKGIREYVAASRLVRQKYPTAIFSLVGPPDPSPDGIDLATVQTWAAEGLIDYQGVLADVRPAIAKCHVYVLPSYHEGMPRSVLEAMAMGRPILTTDVSGCRETVVPGENGWLVPKADAAALAERMVWFIDTHGQCAAMAAASHRMALQKFEVQAVTARMLDIIRAS